MLDQAGQMLASVAEELTFLADNGIECHDVAQIKVEAASRAVCNSQLALLVSIYCLDPMQRRTLCVSSSHTECARKRLHGWAINAASGSS